MILKLIPRKSRKVKTESNQKRSFFLNMWIRPKSSGQKMYCVITETRFVVAKGEVWGGRDELGVWD